MLPTRPDLTADPMSLSHAVEFDHPFTVHPDGTVTDGPAGIYAPSVIGDETTGTEEIDGDGWEFASYGYSGQYGTTSRDPGMHDSEQLAGGLARDILAAPGVYVVCAVYWPADEDDENLTDEEREEGGTWEGWVVLRSTDQRYLCEACDAPRVGTTVDGVNYCTEHRPAHGDGTERP